MGAVRCCARGMNRNNVWDGSVCESECEVLVAIVKISFSITDSGFQ